MRTVFAVSTALFLVAASVEAQEADPLAELAALGSAVSDTGPEAGGSIRAKKEADTGRMQRLNDAKNFEGKVEQVTTKGFPIVAVKVRVAKPAKDGTGKALKANEYIVVVPKLKVENKQVQLQDEATMTNAGAFYLKQGDKVMVRLGEKKATYWEAEYIERK